MRAEVHARVAAEGAKTSGPVVCPFLESEQGACRIYEARPMTCRTYGYYAERDGGLHCNIVTEVVTAHADGDRVVWGNGEAVARELAPLGEPRSLAEHLASHPLR